MIKSPLAAKYDSVHSVCNRYTFFTALGEM